MLCGYFLEQNRARLGLRTLGLTPECQPALLRYDWPGNVREREHLISRAALRARAEGSLMVSLHLHHLGLPATSPTATDNKQAYPQSVTITPLRDAMDDYQRQLLQHALAQQQGNWASAARSLNIDRGNLLRLARRLGLREWIHYCATQQRYNFAFLG